MGVMDLQIDRIEETLMRVEENQKKIMEALGIKEGNSGFNLDFLLPKCLSGRHVRYDALLRGISSGLVRIKNGGLEWRGGSKGLLVYFCGRVWSGDMPRKNKIMGTTTWTRGSNPFPGDALDMYWGAKNMKQIRCRNLGANPPKGFELIDCLFVSASLE